MAQMLFHPLGLHCFKKKQERYMAFLLLKKTVISE
jgi:hypothetical protein